MRRHGKSECIVTDKLASYGAAMRDLGIDTIRHEKDGRWINNRAENSHLPFRRRERAMLRFRRMRSLQKFATVHGSVYNQPLGICCAIACQSTLQPGTTSLQPIKFRFAALRVKENRTASLNEWRQLFAA